MNAIGMKKKINSHSIAGKSSGYAGRRRSNLIVHPLPKTPLDQPPISA
jgi:hypothetical protein